MTRKYNINASVKANDNRFSIWLEELAKIVSPEDWITPTLLNSWTVTTDMSFGYRHLLSLNCVHINGRLTPGTEANNTTIFVLPSGYRPLQSMSFHVVTNTPGASGARFIVDTSGDVRIISADTAGTFYEVNIIFPLDHG